jgi:hypothetical protein
MAVTPDCGMMSSSTIAASLITSPVKANRAEAVAEVNYGALYYMRNWDEERKHLELGRGEAPEDRAPGGYLRPQVTGSVSFQIALQNP